MPTILFVQDNSADGDGIRNALSSQGWHVNIAKNAGEALRSAAEHAPNFVLVDGALADAPSLLKSFSLGNGGPGTVVISPGGAADMTDVDSIPEADEILQRPFTAKDLIELATRRLSTPRRSQGGRSAVRGEVLNAQQIFGGILDELDEEEPAAAQATVAPKSKQPVDSAIPTPEPTIRAPVSAQPPEPADTVTPEVEAAPEVKSPAAKDDSPPPLGDLEDRLNRAMTQALQVAEEVSSASVSMSQVEFFNNLDQEIEDQLAGVLSEVEHPETAKSTPATAPAAQSTPAIEAPKPSAAETGRAAEQTAASSSTVVDKETDDASRKGAESSARTRLYESESQVEAGSDSRESSEESEEYEPVELASLPQKKRTVAIAASVAMVIAIGLFFWFRGGQQEAVPVDQAGPLQQQEFQSEYPPPDQGEAALTDGAEEPEPELSDGSLPESPGTSPASDSSRTSETSDTVLTPADHEPPPVSRKTEPKKPLSTESAARGPSTSKQLSDQSSMSQTSPAVPDRSSAVKTDESLLSRPVQRRPNQPTATSQPRAQTTAAADSLGSTSAATQPRTPSQTPSTESSARARQEVTSGTTTDRTSSPPVQPVQKSPQPAAPAAKKPSPPPPKRVVKRGDLVRPGLGVVVPTLLNLPSAPYPAIARKLKLEAVVRLSVLIDENGRVQEVKVIKPPANDRGFSEAAARAARGAKFKPAMKDGVEVKYWHSVTIRFEL